MQARKVYMIGHYAKAAIFASTCGALMLAAEPWADSATKFDGSWTVIIIADFGPCVRAPLMVRGEVINGIGHYAGAGVDNFSLRVTPSGRVTVTLSMGTAWGVGSGQATQTSASGSWRTRMLAGEEGCSGTWTAQRG